MDRSFVRRVRPVSLLLLKVLKECFKIFAFGLVPSRAAVRVGVVGSEDPSGRLTHQAHRNRAGRSDEVKNPAAIVRLEKVGVLKRINVGRRNRAGECAGPFDLLDRFEREIAPAVRAPRETR